VTTLPSGSGDSGDLPPDLPPDRPKRRRWAIPPDLAAVLVAVIGVGAAWAGRATAPSSSASSPGPAVTTTVTASPSPTAPTAHLEFSLTANSRVPWCQVYKGTGAIPPGYALAIFATPATPDGQPASPAYYSFDTQAIPLTDGHWRTVPLQIGAKGQANFNSDIVGVLVSKSVYRYIKSIRAPWTSETLPPGPTISLPVITNGKRGLPCS